MLRLEKVRVIPAKPVHLVINNAINAETKTALEQIKFAQLDLKVINLSGNSVSLAFFFKNSFTHIILSCQLITLQGEAVYDPASFPTLPFCICVCYEILCRYSNFGLHTRRGAPFQESSSYLTKIFNKKDSSTAIFHLSFGKFLEYIWTENTMENSSGRLLQMLN